MQINKVSVEELSHVYEVLFPTSSLEQEIEKKLEKVSKNAKLSGFRAGKVPPDIVRRQYYDQVFSEQLRFCAHEALNAVVKKFDLKYMAEPRIELDNSDKLKLKVKISIETLPEISIPDFSKIKIIDYNVKITEEDLKKPIENFKESYPNWVTIGADVLCERGHLVELSGNILSNHKNFKPQKFSDTKIIVGNSFYGEEFDARLLGAKIGDRLKFSMKLPKGHRFAGIKLDCNLLVKDIKLKSHFKDIQAIADSTNQTVEQIKEAISNKVKSYYMELAWLAVKRQVLDALAQKCTFPVSKELIEAEFRNIWDKVKQENTDSSKKLTQASEKKLQKEYMDIANRRVKLGFLLAEIGKKEEISVTQEDLKKTIERLALSQGIDVKYLYNYYNANRQALEQIRASVFEEKVIKYILSQTKVSTTEISPAEIEKMINEDEADSSKIAIK